jgi:hypothetical protein
MLPNSDMIQYAEVNGRLCESRISEIMTSGNRKFQRTSVSSMLPFLAEECRVGHCALKFQIHSQKKFNSYLPDGFETALNQHWFIAPSVV